MERRKLEPVLCFPEERIQLLQGFQDDIHEAGISKADRRRRLLWYKQHFHDAILQAWDSPTALQQLQKLEVPGKWGAARLGDRIIWLHGFFARRAAEAKKRAATSPKRGLFSWLLTS